MSAVEEIEAAIAKLTKLRDESAQGPWWAWHPASERGNSSVDAPSGDPDNPRMPVEGERAAVDLIVTLHATIDAQLMTLEAGLETCGAWGDDDPAIERIIGHTLALARAINATS